MYLQKTDAFKSSLSDPIRDAILERCLRETLKPGARREDILIPETPDKWGRTADGLAMRNAVLERCIAVSDEAGIDSVAIRKGYAHMRLAQWQELRRREWDNISLPKALLIAEALKLKVRVVVE